MRRYGPGLLIVCLLVGCGTPVDSRPTPPLIINISPAPTENLAATTTAFALETVPTEQPRGLYVVREGDTLETIAIAFNTSVDEITVTNKISDANTIYIGQQLVIPTLLTSTLPLSDTEDQDQSNDVVPTP